MERCNTKTHIPDKTFELRVEYLHKIENDIPPDLIRDYTWLHYVSVFKKNMKK